MRIGLISDLHANLPATQAVLAALDREAVDLILCAGDLVCYGAQPNEVLALLRRRGVPCVLGNYDAAAGWGNPISRKPSSPATEALKQAAMNWTRAILQPAHRRFLRGLPWTHSGRYGGLSLTLLHAGPEHLDEAILPEHTQRQAEIARRTQAEVLVLGHTHLAFAVDHGDLLCVNPGAVGRALDGDVRAAYAVLDTVARRAELRRVDYDVDSAIQAITAAGLPADLAELIRRGARRLEEPVTAHDPLA